MGTLMGNNVSASGQGISVRARVPVGFPEGHPGQDVGQEQVGVHPRGQAQGLAARRPPHSHLPAPGGSPAASTSSDRWPHLQPCCCLLEPYLSPRGAEDTEDGVCLEATVGQHLAGHASWSWVDGQVQLSLP